MVPPHQISQSIQTLQSHAIQWQLHWRLSIFVLLRGQLIVVSGIDVLCQTKVSNLYHIVEVNPNEDKDHNIMVRGVAINLAMGEGQNIRQETTPAN